MNEKLGWNENTQEIVLFSSCDENYAMPTAVMLYSALRHWGRERPAAVYVLDGGVSQTSRERFEGVFAGSFPHARLSWLRPDLDTRGLHIRSDLNLSSYLRLLAPQLLPAAHSRAIYLDSDMIVERSLAPVWEKPLGDYAVHAVQDYGIPTLGASYSGLRETVGELDLDPAAPYFNSGLMLLDMARLREEGQFERAIAYSRRYSRLLRHADQDGLNAILSGEWGRLAPEWNVLLCLVRHPKYWPQSDMRVEVERRLRPFRRNACVLHFCGPTKPWLAGISNVYRSRFTRNLRASGWFSEAEFRRWQVGWLRTALPHFLDVVRRRLVG